VLASINMAGGFVVTDRMLQMFSGRKQLPPGRGGSDDGRGDQ
jgi:hypothetical protein